MIKLILFSFLAFSNETVSIEEEAVFSKDEVRCQYVSEKHGTVIHQFSYHEWEIDKGCLYGIKHNERVLASSKASVEDCQWLIKIEESRGSNCLKNKF